MCMSYRIFYFLFILLYYIYNFLKKILRPKWNTENNLVYSDLCRLNMQMKSLNMTERYIKMIRYWLKIV